MKILCNIGPNWAIGGKDRALRLIDLAAGCGVHGVVFELFNADKLYRDETDRAKFRPFELNEDWIPELRSKAREQGLKFILAPYYLSALRFDVDAWKVDSSELTHEPLLRKMGEEGSPVYLGVAGADMEEIDSAIEWLRPDTERPEDIVIMHDSFGKPTKTKDLNLKKILDLGQEFFPLSVGASVHHTNLALAAIPVFYMADVLEVDFDGEDKKGIASAWSLAPSEVKQLMLLIRSLEDARQCKCAVTLVDEFSRIDKRRDKKDWLRPVL